MSYRIEWEPDALSAIDRLDPWFAQSVLDGADRLAAAPTRLSRGQGWPFYGRDQRYLFEVDGRPVVLFFKYSQDEQTLLITDVSVA